MNTGNDGGNKPLAEHEQTLVPEHGELLHVARATRLVRVREADEVEDERVDDLVRQRVLLVEEHADEERVCACQQRSAVGDIFTPHVPVLPA